MPKGKAASSKSNDSGLNFEAQLWAAADKMCGHVDASEYRHVCLGLIFLKYISDAFEEKCEQRLFGFSDPKSEWLIMKESRTLAALLPKLLSGESRVPTAKLTEAIA